MPERRWALSVPLEGYTNREHVEISRELETRGYTDAWSLEVDGVDVFSPLAAVALSTNMRVGTAIANVFTRGPATLAQSAAGMAELAPGRFQLGIGSGSQTTVESWNSMKFERPLTRVREMVSFLRKALTGERVVFEGETFSVDGFRLGRPPTNEVPIHVAALREGMLRLAGEVADGCIVNWLSADDVRTSVKTVREAAAAAGRDPAGVEITARLMVNIDPPGETSDLVSRRQINAYLQVPVYAAFHRWLGRGPVLEPMWDAWAAGDRRGAVAAIPDQVVDALIVRGSAEDRRQHVLRYMDAGVDTAFLHLFTAETDPTRKRAIVMQAMRDLSPAAYR